MVLNTSIELAPLVAYIGGIVSKLIYDEISRFRKKQIQEKNEKIEWYGELSKLSHEIKHISVSHNKIHEIVADDSVPIEAFYDKLSEEDQTKYALLNEIGVEEPEEVVQEQLEELSVET